MDTTIITNQNKAHICGHGTVYGCKKEYGSESGKFYFDDLFPVSWYCYGCISKLAAMKLGVKIKSSKEYFSTLYHVKGTTKK